MKNVDFNIDPKKLVDPKMDMNVQFPAYMNEWEMNLFKLAYIKNHLINKNV